MSSDYNVSPFDEEMALFETLLPYVLPAVPTCSNMLAVQNLRRAAIDLCQESRIWRSTQHPLPLGNSDCEYEFEPPDTADRVRIEWVTYGGVKLEPTTEHQLFKCDKDWILRKGKPTKFMEMNTGVIRLWPTPEGWISPVDPYIPDGTGSDISADDNDPCSVIVRISCRPSLAATGMNREVMTDHYNAIVNGALAYLYMTPGHPWTDIGLGQQYQGAFTQGIARAQLQAVDGNLSPVRTTSYGGL